MVFAGQDAWRKHHLLADCYKRPLPGLGVAVGIFSLYLLADFIGQNGTGNRAPVKIPKKVTFTEGGAEGDTMPTAKFSKH